LKKRKTNLTIKRQILKGGGGQGGGKQQGHTDPDSN